MLEFTSINILIIITVTFLFLSFILSFIPFTPFKAHIAMNNIIIFQITPPSKVYYILKKRKKQEFLLGVKKFPGQN